MADKPLRLVLTFKQSEKWIYDAVNEHSGKGNWIKDILVKELKKEQQEHFIPVKRTVDEVL